MSNKDAIQIEGLNVELGGQSVLSDIHMHITEGEIAFIIGPNGGGKTTLVKTIMGLIQGRSGSIKIFGKTNTASQVARTIAYVPQYAVVDRTFPITVYEMLEVTYKKLSPSQITKALVEMEMRDYANQKIGNLSGGEFQRVLIARALLNRPKILILDEPTNNLDAKTQERLFRLVKKLNKKLNLTTIVITHDINIISSVAQRVICINRRLECSGVPHEIMTPEVLRKVYGVPLAEYTHEHGFGVKHKKESVHE
jgi:zinc transport system ATP-binding protein